jgi:hypothetical protein
MRQNVHLESKQVVRTICVENALINPLSHNKNSSVQINPPQSYGCIFIKPFGIAYGTCLKIDFINMNNMQINKFILISTE